MNRERSPYRGGPWLVLEQLEPRLLLDGHTASHVFVQFQGSLADPADRATMTVELFPGQFAASRTGQVMLGFHVRPAEGSQLDPNAVVLTDGSGADPLVPRYISEDLPGGPDSLVLCDLSEGSYEIVVSCAGSTWGEYALDILLVGDADGDRDVDRDDTLILSDSFGLQSGGLGYVLEADANFDGVITSFDAAQHIRNIGAAIGPFELTASLSPLPSASLPDGTPLTNNPALGVVGATSPGAVLDLDLDGDGFDDGSAVADASGQYSLPILLAEGLNTLQVQATDGFGRQRQAALSVALDTMPPVVATPDLIPGSDTGPSETDNVTNDSTPTLTVAAEPGSLVRLLVDDVEIGSALADDGTAVFDLADLPQGAMAIQGISDATASAPTYFPGELNIEDYLNIKLNLGRSGGDQATPLTRAQGDLNGDGAVDSLDLWILEANWNSSAEPVPAASPEAMVLADGWHTFTATAEDPTGNIATSGPLSMLVDTAPPDVVFDLADAFDTDTPGDGRTVLPTVTLSGTTEPVTPVELFRADDLLTPIASGQSDASGDFAFADVDLAMGENPLRVTATDLAGNVGAHERVIIREMGGVLLVEGTDFQVVHEETVVVPSEPSTLVIAFSSLVFDTADDFVNDAFELALLDSAGHSLVHTIGGGRDAFFNMTEGLSARLGVNAVLNGWTVKVDLAHIPAGTEVRLVARLVNNDADTTSSVRIGGVYVELGSLGTPVGATPTQDPAQPATEIDFSSLSDVASSMRVQYGRTSFGEASGTLFATAAIQNAGTFLVDSPLLLVVDHLSDPTVAVLNRDGRTPDGRPYFDLSGLLAEGTLDPGDVTSERSLAFLNPNGVQFTFDLVVLGQLNRAPTFTSDVRLEALVGKPYSYDANARDLDGDALAFSLAGAPAGMTIDPQTGLVQWTPSPDDEGSQSVRIRVTDGRGGVGEQSYSLSVLDQVPNRPPHFTTGPAVDAAVHRPYEYDVDAYDPDQDAVSFLLVEGPPGMAIDSATGLMEWTPTVDQAGQHNVEILASDGCGGEARQNYAVCARPEPGNSPPVIVSDPVTTAKPDEAYQYQVVAVDPEYDPVTFFLVEGPDGISVEPASGLVQWTPLVSQAGLHDVAVRAVDDRGAEAQQSYVVDVALNHAPVIVTDAPGAAYEGREYRYDVDAIDPEGDPLTYELVEGPLGMEIDPASGLVNWEHRYDVDLALGLGGAGGIASNAVATDQTGCVYVAGTFSGTVDLDPGEGMYELTASGYDAFVLKLSGEGDLLWAVKLGSSGSQERANDIDIDSDGNVYITGSFGGRVDFDPGDGVYELVSGGGVDAYVWKLDTDGNFLWAHAAGGSSSNAHEYGTEVTTAEDGCVYVTGFFIGAGDFDPGPGVQTLTSAGGEDAFIWKLDADGNHIWARSAGGVVNDRGAGVAVGADGNVHIVGHFSATADFDPGPGVQELQSIGDQDAFVWTLDSEGSFLWMGQVGGVLHDEGNSVAVDAHGDIYVTGHRQGEADLDPGPGVDLFSGFATAFVLRLTSDGQYVWGRTTEGFGNGWGYDVAVSSAGIVYTTGVLNGTADFDPGPEIHELVRPTGQYDAYVWALDQDGEYEWAIWIGHPGHDYGNGVTVDGEGDLWAVGSFAGTQRFGEGDEAPELVSQGPNQNGFLIRYPNHADVALRVEDGRGGFDEQAFSIEFVDPTLMDLTIRDVDAHDLLYDGQTLTARGMVTAVVDNKGPEAAAKGFDVLFFEDRDHNKVFDEATDIALGRTVISEGLMPGESVAVSAYVSGPVLFAGNIVWGIVDSKGVIPETNEANNRAHSGQNCVAVPPPGEFNPIIEWSRLSFDEYPDHVSVTMAAVADVNDDGVPDVIAPFTAWNGSSIGGVVLRALDGIDGEVLWSKQMKGQEAFYSVSSPAIGDIDGDGRPEMIFATHIPGSGVQSHAIAFEHDGTFKWLSPVDCVHVGYGGFSLADLNGDGMPEIVGGPVAMNSDGSLLWDGRDSGALGIGGNMSGGSVTLVADLDMDGSSEVVAGKSALHADGSLYWNADVPDGFAGIGNFDEDPNPEIVLVAEGNVYLLEHTGEIKWGPAAIPTGPGGLLSFGGAPMIADLDGDGELEIGTHGYSKYAVFETDGTIKWQADILDDSPTSSTAFDFDGDGVMEVVYGDMTALRIFRGTDGQLLFEMPKNSGTFYEYPIVADVDADGSAEIVCGANDYGRPLAPAGIYVLGDANGTWLPTRQTWNQHTYHVTNVNDDATIPADEANSWEEYNTYRVNAPLTLETRPSPNLTASFLRLEVVGEVITITARVGNGGATTAPSEIPVSVYNGSPQAGGTLLGTVEVTSRLAPGWFEDVQLTVPVDAIDPDDIWVWADDGGTGRGKINECNEYDNLYRIRLSWDDNRAPAITSNPPIEAEPPLLYRYDAAAIDPDGETLTFDLPVRPDGMAVAPLTGTVVWTPTGEQVGVHDVILRASDESGGAVLQAFQVTVGPENTAPVITSSPGLIATLGVTYQYHVNAQDAESDPLEFWLSRAAWTFLGHAISIDPETGLLAWTAASMAVGDGPWITVLVTDGRARADAQTYFPILVEFSENVPPAIVSTPRAGIGVGGTYLYQVVAEDLNSDLLTYSLETAPDGMSIDEFGLVHWAPSASQLGANEVAVRVDDVRGDFAMQEFTIHVTERTANAAPVITTTPRLGATVDWMYAYDATADDPDQDVLLWALETAPAGMSIDPRKGTIRWQPTRHQIGTHKAKVVVMDAHGGRAEQIFTVTVRGVNAPPAITSAPPTWAGVGRDYTYSLGANDPDGDDLTFSLITGPDGMAIDPETGCIDWVPTPTQVGAWPVEVQIDDGRSGQATQTYEVVVLAELTGPPAITSTPPVLAVVSTPYQYPVTAADSDGDAIVLSLGEAPDGMTLDPATGTIHWTPSAGQAGSQTVEIVATDARGALARQRFSIDVAAENHTPTIYASAVKPAYFDLPWGYDVHARDADGDPLAYALDDAPAGMTIDALGRIRWTPTADDEGVQPVRVLVSDPYGATRWQTFDVPVTADTQAPNIGLDLSHPDTLEVRQLNLPDGQFAVGLPITLRAWAVDNVAVASVQVTVDGHRVLLDARDQANLLYDALGQHAVTVTASDLTGNSQAADFSFEVVDPYDVQAPEVSILSPEAGTTVTDLIGVVGTATDDQLDFYVLEVAPLSGDTFTEIARGTEPIQGDILGTLDPTVLANDTYILRLRAVDSQGNSSSISRQIFVAGDVKLGNFALSFTDLTIPVSGIPITVARTYDTLNAGVEGDFGPGWRLEISDTDLRTSLPKTGLEELGSSTAAHTPFRYGTRVYVTTPGGRREGFTFTPTPPQGLGEVLLGIWHPAFTPDPGVRNNLTVKNVQLQYNENTGEFEFFTGWGYNPADTELGDGVYTLTAPEGIVYTIDALTGDLRTLRDPNGNTLTFADNGIHSSAGPAVEFERDPQGRISAVIDPAGNRIAYEYDASGELVGVTDREGNETRFTYLDDRPAYLDEIIDPLGRTGVRSEYDEHGRLVRLIDADGNPVEIIHDPDASTETVLDALGNPTSYVYDDRGNVTREIDALGGVTVYTYDLDNNVLSQTDPLGNTTTYTYDAAGNQKSVTDPLGNATYYTYGPWNRLLTTSDPLGNTTTYTYDSRGNMLSTTDALGNTTTYTYDGAGNQMSMTDALRNLTTYDYDGRGNLIRQVDALGHETTYTYDANGNQLTTTTTLTTPAGVRTLTTTREYDGEGRVVRVTDAEGNVTRTEYDAVGNTAATIDGLGHRTEYRYDDRGQLAETIYPDDTPADLTNNPRIRTEYDAAGRTIARIDELGHRTEFRYDALGRTIETIYPDDTPADINDNPRTRTEYDAAGRVIAQIDELGNRTRFVYDEAGRQTVVEDALGNKTHTFYDNAGRLTAQTDPLGHTTQFVHDALGRAVQTVYADDTRTSVTYDALGRSVAQTDQVNRTTHYEYDPLGRLTAVVDALDQRTEYAYDEAGNFTTQTDANGHTTTYEYDGLGQRIATVLPLGQRSFTEHDAVGNVQAATDFNGDTIQYEYDARNRLTAKRFPDDTSVEFTYTPTGQQETVLDSRGTTAYAYDPRGRLLSRTDPDGRAIAYTYDLAGNRTSVIIPSGTTTYTFDALSRMQTVTDPDDGVTTYTYDDAGRLIRTDLPNGTFEVREYDALNRVLLIEHTGPAGAFASFSYTLNPVAQRIAADEFLDGSSRLVEYTYDDLDRLIQEAITDSVNGDRRIGYTLDPVGNRLSRADSAEGETTYTYDDNDRMLAQTLGDVATTYRYDNNGNTLSTTTGPDVQIIYNWDLENRLVAADVTDGSAVKHIDYGYDTNGIRVSRSVDDDETRFLIDANRSYAQVLEQYAPDGTVSAFYVHGRERISQESGTGQSWYHADTIGSTRALTDTAGAVTDSYSYDAFGRAAVTTGATPTAYLFAGEDRDGGVNLDYLRARYLDFSSGRFLSVDPLAGSLSQPASLHRFAYASSNPVSYRDPTGLTTLNELLASTNIQGILRTVNIGGRFLRFSRLVDRIQHVETALVMMHLAAWGSVTVPAFLNGDLAGSLHHRISGSGNSWLSLIEVDGTINSQETRLSVTFDFARAEAGNRSSVSASVIRTHGGEWRLDGSWSQGWVLASWKVPRSSERPIFETELVAETDVPFGAGRDQLPSFALKVTADFLGWATLALTLWEFK